jgi:hypothetical protein
VGDAGCLVRGGESSARCGGLGYVMEGEGIGRVVEGMVIYWYSREGRGRTEEVPRG